MIDIKTSLIAVGLAEAYSRRSGDEIPGIETKLTRFVIEAVRVGIPPIEILESIGEGERYGTRAAMFVKASRW